MEHGQMKNPWNVIADLDIKTVKYISAVALVEDVLLTWEKAAVLNST